MAKDTGLHFYSQTLSFEATELRIPTEPVTDLSFYFIFVRVKIYTTGVILQTDILIGPVLSLGHK